MKEYLQKLAETCSASDIFSAEASIFQSERERYLNMTSEVFEGTEQEFRQQNAELLIHVANIYDAIEISKDEIQQLIDFLKNSSTDCPTFMLELIYSIFSYDSVNIAEASYTIDLTDIHVHDEALEHTKLCLTHTFKNKEMNHCFTLRCFEHLRKSSDEKFYSLAVFRRLICVKC